jgi:hypothetical protein
MPNIARLAYSVKREGRNDEYRAERYRKKGKERVLALLRSTLSFREI